MMVVQKNILNVMQLAISQALANVHTATIARVVKVEATTIDVQPVIARVVNDTVVQLPVFAKVPPVFMQGGATYTAHPIAVGDYALLVFTERCFDRWYAGQDGQAALEYRMHDYSDGFAFVGINPQASALSIPVGHIKQVGELRHDGDVFIVGDVDITGNLRVTGTISAGNFTGLNGGALTSTSDIISNGISLQTHVHSGVQSGGSNTGQPV